ncbi:hypothetical protein [Streptomyces milbemycinicus]|uniref:Uncharacterized protein n=1 Tax=Streptomyces milbemycinicus TaxID=476552 RepID=A0ABW8LMX8_9ACTN
MHPDALAALVNSLGIPTVAGRASANRQHVPSADRRCTAWMPATA